MQVCLALQGFIFQMANTYKVIENHTNDNDYISDYESINEALKSLYGEPDGEFIDWKNDLYKNDPQQYGFAVSAGHLVYGARWTANDGSIVIHMLSGDNFEISHDLDYISGDFAEDADSSGPNTSGL